MLSDDELDTDREQKTCSRYNTEIERGETAVSASSSCPPSFLPTVRPPQQCSVRSPLLFSQVTGLFSSRGVSTTARSDISGSRWSRALQQVADWCSERGPDESTGGEPSQRPGECEGGGGGEKPCPQTFQHRLSSLRRRLHLRSHGQHQGMAWDKLSTLNLSILQQTAKL